MSKAIIFLGVVLFLGVVFCFAEENITITTYYPAPYGVYKELRGKRMALGDSYYDSSQYCWEGNCSITIDSNADLIVEGNVGIGTVNSDVKLHIQDLDKSPDTMGQEVLRITANSSSTVIGSGPTIRFTDNLNNFAGKIHSYREGNQGFSMLFSTATFTYPGIVQVLMLTPNGKVGIGTLSPVGKLQVEDEGFNMRTVTIGEGTDITTQAPWTTAARLYFEGRGIKSGVIAYRKTPVNDMEFYFTADASGYDDTTTTVRINGNLYVSGYKSFEIDHPTKENMKLVHASLEGPEIAVFYRGEAKLKNGKTVVVLPDYFEALTRKEGRTIQLTPKGKEPYLLSTTDVVDGSFRVYGTKSDGEFFWEVKAVRADVEPLKVEMPKKQYESKKNQLSHK
jgi:hypothetical protein